MIAAEEAIDWVRGLEALVEQIASRFRRIVPPWRVSLSRVLQRRCGLWFR